MDDNLLARAKQALGGEFPRLAGDLLGTSEESVRSALAALLPAVIGVVAQRGAAPGGGDALLAQLHEAPIDPGMRGNLASLFDGTGAEAVRLMRTGSDLVGLLFGDRRATLASAAARASGMEPGPASELLALLVPIVLGLLKKLVRDRRLDAAGLAELLGRQGTHLHGALDARIEGALGAASPLAGDVALLGEGRGASKVLPWVLAAVGLVILFLLLRTCATPVEKAPIALPSEKTDALASSPSSAASR